MSGPSSPVPVPGWLRSRRHLFGISLSILIILLLALIASGAGGAPRSVRSLADRTPVLGRHCPDSRLNTTTVSVTVAPEIEDVVSRALVPLRTRTLPGRRCVRVTLAVQDPRFTVRASELLPPDRAPDLWIPDSSIWAPRVGNWPLDLNGSFAGSPVVLVTSRATADARGWSDTPPTWAQALSGAAALAMPAPTGDASSMSALISLWLSAGKGVGARRALASAVLAAGRGGDRAGTAALPAIRSGGADAPLLAIAEQAVGEQAVDTSVVAGGSGPVIVRPSGGSPILNYPLLTSVRPAPGPALADRAAATARSTAVQAVVDELLGERAGGLLTAAGFRAPPAGPNGPPTRFGDGGPVAGLTPADLIALVGRIDKLTTPSRILTMIDMSTSMAAPAGGGRARIQLAAAAVTAADKLLPDSTQVGLWRFVRNHDQKVVPLVPVAELGRSDGARVHRRTIDAAIDVPPGKLGGDGSPLFAAAIAGVTEMTGSFDPQAVNTVLLLSDGANLDPGGPSLKRTLDTLHRLHDRAKPVTLICIGVGKDVKMGPLTAMAKRTGGRAYHITRPDQLPSALLSLLSRRAA